MPDYRGNQRAVNRKQNLSPDAGKGFAAFFLDAYRIEFIIKEERNAIEQEETL
jgi:hypothetical protein